ncbi:LuxR C-terminal-related transcriptional regulator [Yoonia sp. R2331]|uniref:LuxR C-terminal-related transcriptional regulator n=1 Tax=Yoonia sp. R2331 TaxID=3237238 RepID=UPI0034E3934C
MKDDTVATDQGITADTQAIENLLTREINAFFALDYDAWADCYLHSDRLRSTMMSHELGLDVRIGWQAHAEGTRLHFEGTPPGDAQWEKQTDQIVVRGDMAWVTCRARTNTALCMMGETYETWVLERHDGAWKIACVNVMAARSNRHEVDGIAVDAEGRVVGLNARASARLQQHPAFTIRDGRLRATDADTDRALQAAIGRAGALHGFFEQAAYAEMEGQRFAYPIVIAGDDDSGHAVIMLTVQDRLTYLDIGASQATMARVDVAATVFALSEAQHRVAAGIVAGQSLPEIAAALQISPATAKTHLQRVYLKTGASTMTALVRTLLSIG